MASGNGSASFKARALPAVLSLRARPYISRVSQPPVLSWPSTPRATYYHVQLFRGTKLVYAAWPEQPQITLPRRWKWQGEKHSLRKRATYRWFVWAGLRERRDERFKRIGKSKFRVVAPPPAGAVTSAGAP